MHTIIKELKEILEKASKQDNNWDNYFEDQVVSLEEVVADFEARMTEHENTDWAYENKISYSDHIYENGRE